MREKHFGDSYDLVKRALLGWLRPMGNWGIHPMFTEVTSDIFVRAYSELLGTPLVSTEILQRASDRRTYFAPCSQYQHCFLDPNTGLKIQPEQGENSVDHLFVPDLEAALGERRGITVVFDQSTDYARDVGEQLQEKLAFLRGLDLSCFAYRSHACFMFVSRDRQLMTQSLEFLTLPGRLPRARFMYEQGT